MKNLILFSIITLALTSCSDKYYNKQCLKHLNKAIEGKCVDTSTKVKYVVKNVKGDTVFINSPLDIDDTTKAKLFDKDTCFTEVRIQTIFKNIKIKPIDTTTRNGNRFVAHVVNGALKVEIFEKSRKDTTAIIKPEVNIKPIVDEKKSFIDNIWFYLFLMAIGYILLKKIFKD